MAKAVITDSEDFHRFTRGRFVQQEALEMAARYTSFDVNELAKVAADSVGSRHCVRFEKIGEGDHNKAFLATMDDGKEVIAKVPHPKAGPSFYTTASEVATMDLMRSLLPVPVPQVYTWCDNAGQSPVGSEYIIMEKAYGVPLSSAWPKMSVKEHYVVMRQLVSCQSAWCNVQYPGYGSIYFATDLPKDKQLPITNLHGEAKYKKYAVGPITGREWSESGRGAVAVDRGPWQTVGRYLVAIGRREEDCVRGLPRLPYSDLTICGPNLYVRSEERKLKAIRSYLQLLSSITPSSDPVLTKPSAWHADLHWNNIFVDPAQPTKLTALIDWQSTEVVPLIYQARQPHILEHDGPVHTGLEKPTLPKDLATLPPAEKALIEKLYVAQSLCLAWRTWIHAKVPDVWKCLEYQSAPDFDLLVLARNLLVDGEASYNFTATQKLVSAGTISFSDAEMRELETESVNAINGMTIMTSIRNSLRDEFPD